MERGEKDEKRQCPESRRRQDRIVELDSEDLAMKLLGAIESHYDRMGAGPILKALEKAIDDHIESERIKKLEPNVQLTLIEQRGDRQRSDGRHGDR